MCEICEMWSVLEFCWFAEEKGWFSDSDFKEGEHAANLL